MQKLKGQGHTRPKLDLEAWQRWGAILGPLDRLAFLVYTILYYIYYYTTTTTAAAAAATTTTSARTINDSFIHSLKLYKIWYQTKRC